MNDNMNGLAGEATDLPTLPSRAAFADSRASVGSVGSRRHAATGKDIYGEGTREGDGDAMNGVTMTVNATKAMAETSDTKDAKNADQPARTAPSGFLGTIRSSRLGLTTFDIKMIGVVLMVVDHVHQMFATQGAPSWLDWFGRPVATLFFFVSVVGFSHTHSKKAYMVRLYVCMALMAVMDYVLQLTINYDGAQLVNNIFRDLFIGTIFMAAVDCFEAAFKKRGGKRDERTGSAHGVAGRDAVAGISNGISASEQITVPVTSHADGVTRGYRVKKTAEGLLLLALPFLLSLVLLPFMSIGDGQQGMVTMWALRVLTAIDPAILLAENTIMVLLIPVMYALRNVRHSLVWQSAAIAVVAVLYAMSGQTQWMMIFAIIPILLYNGAKGRGDKYFFYVFYPAHIAVLYVLASLI
ncbi:MAG: hypothetical protein J6575_02820 [Bifidobacterium sp.]|nr:hypothetical protein [Bifidobacterium sp.]